MEWTKHEQPDDSGTYIISLELPSRQGKFVTNYVAFYDFEQKKWFKYDPFLLEPIGEQISFDLINGWKSSSVFLK